MKPKLSEYWIRILTSTLLICFCPHPAHGQEAVAKVDRFSILSSGSLTIWGTDMPDFMDDQPVQAALNKEFPRLKVNFRTFNRANFLPALASAKTDGNLPDALFVGNWLLAEPMMAQLSVVELMGQPRFQSRGWWFALEDAGHNARGEAFLRWMEEPPPGWTVPASSTMGMTAQDRRQSSVVAVKTVLEMAGPTDPSSTMDKDANRFSPTFGVGCGHADSITDASVDLLFGNGRIAYAALSSEAKTKGTVSCIGQLHSFVVLRKKADGWKVLLLMASTSLAQAESYAEGFERLGLLAGPAAEPAMPQLISPHDGEAQTRFPKQEIAWAQAANAVAYIVEARAGVVKNTAVEFGASGITFVDPQKYGSVVRMPSPFGVGMQPHRWRVWAIGKDGTVALSEWRTVNFTN